MSEKPAEHKAAEMGFMDHLSELRYRLLNIFLAAAICSIFGFIYSSELAFILNRPYFEAFGAQSMLTGTGPAEAFILRMKLAFFGGILISSPVIFYQVWSFVEPGFHPNERKLLIPFVFCSTALFLLGVWFCYTWVFPYAFTFFFEQYQNLGLTPAIRMTEHMSTMLRGLIGFGVVFEMPVLAFFLGRAGLIDHHMLISGTRYAVVLIFVVAAVLTPPDVLTQLIMAGPLLLLYGLSIIIVKYSAAPCSTQE